MGSLPPEPPGKPQAVFPSLLSSGSLLLGQPANLALQPVIILCIFPYIFCLRAGDGVKDQLRVTLVQSLLLLKVGWIEMIKSQALMFPTASLFSDS